MSLTKTAYAQMLTAQLSIFQNANLGLSSQLAMPPAGLAAEGALAQAEQAGDPHPQEDQCRSASWATDPSAGPSLLRWWPDLGMVAYATLTAKAVVWAVVPVWPSAYLFFHSTRPCACCRHVLSRRLEAASGAAVVCHRLAVSPAWAAVPAPFRIVLSCEIALFAAASESSVICCGLGVSTS